MSHKPTASRTDVIAAVAILAGVLIGAPMGLISWTCHARWSDFESDWGPIAGCRVKIDGKWIPENRVREWGSKEGRDG